MARQLLVNGRPIADHIAARVGDAVWLTLSLTDVDAAPGDSWAVSTAPPTLVTFNPATADVAAGASSPVHLLFESQAGFTKPGNHKVLIHKVMGTGADPLSAVWTLNFQVAAAAQPAPQPHSNLSTGFILAIVAFLLAFAFAFKLTVLDTLHYADESAMTGMNSSKSAAPAH